MLTALLDQPLDRISSRERLPAALDPELVQKYFALSDLDLKEIHLCRGAVNKISFAIQLCCLRWFGYLLPDMTAVPTAVREAIATQLCVDAAVDVSGYPHSEDARTEHPERIRGYLEFSKCDELQRLRLLNQLIEQAMQLSKTTSLTDMACRWLYEERIVRPAARTIKEICGSASEIALERVFAIIAGELTPNQQARIDELLTPQGEAGLSRMDAYKALPKRESPDAILQVVELAAELRALGFSGMPGLRLVHKSTLSLLASWAYRYDVWSMRRFPPLKRYSIVIAFVAVALTEATDAAIDMHDKLMTSYNNKAKRRRDELLQRAEQARSEAIVAFEDVGALVLDESVLDTDLRSAIFRLYPVERLTDLVTDCRALRFGDDSSHLEYLQPWYGQLRRYLPALLENIAFQFPQDAPLTEAIAYLKEINLAKKRKLDNQAPTAFLSKRWQKHVIKEKDGKTEYSKPHFEFAAACTISEKIKAGDGTVAESRRWSTFEDLLIPETDWQRDRLEHYAKLGLPIDPDQFITAMQRQLESITTAVDAGVPHNEALTINFEKSAYSLSRPKKTVDEKAAKPIKRLIQAHMPRIDTSDLLIDTDNATGFLRHFAIPATNDTRLPVTTVKRNALAALVARGCFIGSQRMEMASGISQFEISRIADWYFGEEALKAATIDIVNYGSSLPYSALFGQGDTWSGDGMRFYAPVNILASEYSPVLKERGLTWLTHTADNYLMPFHQPIPCRKREALYELDGLELHDTELDPKTCFTDTHGYTEVVMATAHLLGFALVPRIADMPSCTLYRFDKSTKYQHLEPLLKGRIKPKAIAESWDQVVRVVASMRARTASPSLILNRLSSYARQNSVYQALREIGRIDRTIHILRCIDSEQLRQQETKELNKGEASHKLDRFLAFGKEGAFTGREFYDQLHTSSCLAILHNAVIAWNLDQIPQVVAKLRAEGHQISDAILSHVTPLIWKHINPFGRYHFNIDRMKRV
jgi:TnpA family transposase